MVAATRNLLALLILCSTISVSGQRACVKNQFVGRWKEVELIPGDHSGSIDSLKHVIDSSTRDLGLLTFYPDETYTYSYLDTYDKKKKTYEIKSELCQIILREKRRSDEQSNIEIIHIDNNHLIFKEDNYSRGYFTHLFVRK